jgi:methylglyoxal synthase
MPKHGTVAFITTPEFRKAHAEQLEEFVYQHLYFLCRNFNVLTTGRTHDTVLKIVRRQMSLKQKEIVSQATDLPIKSKAGRDVWVTTITQGMQKMASGIQGMILITHSLVEGNVDAVIHLTDWADVAGKPDSMVLRREANVHNVHIASDINSAKSAIRKWGALLQLGRQVFRTKKQPEEQPLAGLTADHEVLALIAHDGMKLDMCCFVVEHAQQIFRQFDFILATGTTGQWIKKFMLAAGRNEDEVERVRCCQSGPRGGDVQIAAAVVKRICRKVIFLQDPFVSHAHETDIRLFEQAVLLFERAALQIEVELATNVESAKMILEPEA